MISRVSKFRIEKLFFSLAVLLCLGATALQSAPEKKAEPAKPKVEPEVTLSYAEQVAARQSVFDENSKTGRDPFFPKSSRRGEKSGPKAQISSTLAAAAHLTLKGLLGTSGKPLALINNQTFAPGESNIVRTPSGQVRLRCLEINDTSVVILVDGESQRRELFLRGAN